jgi:bifunctional non-homologous end joining protein LigD
MGGVLKSWAVPRGPSLDPREKRLAVLTEDHPVEYLKFEGRIPEGNYGAGEQLIWDAGTYDVAAGTDPLAGLRDGKLSFHLHGNKLRGGFNLLRMKGREDQWLLVKSEDRFARPGWKLDLVLGPNGPKREEDKKTPRRRAAGSARKHGAVARGKSGKALSARRAFASGALAGDVDVAVGNKIVNLTNLDKVYWPTDGYTKSDLIKYYYEVSRYILPYLKDRPLIMRRYPNGIGGSSFHQHDVDQAPDYVRTASLETEDGHFVDYIIGDGLGTLLYMSNLGAIERHPWHSRVQSIERPDWVVFDLDPGEASDFGTICDLALKIRESLERLGLECYPKTSGSRGMHIYIPLRPAHTYEETAAFAEAIAAQIARDNPQTATVERSLKRRRKEQVYIDHMQNAQGKSMVAPYSVRPRAGAPVSAPLAWDEVKGRKITIQDFTITNMLRRLEAKGDLFAPVLKRKQRLAGALAAIRERERASGPTRGRERE